MLLSGGVSPRIKLYLAAIRYFQKVGYTGIAKFFAARLQIKYSIFISHKANYSDTFELKHPIGIVIGEGVRIGERVKIFQNVTIGGARLGDAQENNYPKIGDDTVIFAGAVVIGNIKIGKNCIVGANSVVTCDVPDYTTVAGVPARIIKKRTHQTL